MKMLLVDAGNSSLKWTTLEKGKLSKQQRIFYDGELPIIKFQSLLKIYSDDCKTVVLVSVLGDEFNQEAQKIVMQASLTFKQIKSVAQLAGVKNAYADAHKLGADRFVSMIGAYHLIKGKQQPSEACIIVDSGTATTIDAIDAKGQHLGGLILPGIQLCSNSLLEKTQLLPLWNKHGEKAVPELFATETTQAIASASIFGLVGAIESISNKMQNAIALREQNKFGKEQESSCKKIICGGSAEELLPFLESDFQLNNDLVMQGLKVIIEKGKGL